MAWNWDQSQGRLYRNNQFVAEGYSGGGIGLNNPLMQGHAPRRADSARTLADDRGP